MSIPHLYIPSQTEIDHAIAGLFGDGDETGARRYLDAAALLSAGAIAYCEGDGWTVASQGSQPGTRYHVTGTRCTCYDQRHHGNECKHQLTVRLYLKIITARLRADISAPFGVDVSCDGRAAVVVTREEEPQVICAVISTRQGWRPATGADVAAYAEYLAGALGEDQVSLDWILAHSQADELALTFDVYYGGPMFFAGYHQPGTPWVKFQFGDRQVVNPDAADAIIRARGWELAQRPVRGAGISHRYLLRRVATNPADHAPGYSVASRTDAAVERAHLEQIAARCEGRAAQPGRALAQELIA